MVGVVSFTQVGTGSVKVTGYFATDEYYQIDDYEKIRFEPQQTQIVVVEFRQTQFRLAIPGANVDDPMSKTYNVVTGATDHSKCLEVLAIGGTSSFASASVLADTIASFFDQFGAKSSGAESSAQRVTLASELSKTYNATFNADTVKGIVPFAVRKTETDAALASSGAYIPLTTNQFGQLRVSTPYYADASGRISMANSVILGEYRFVRDITKNANSHMSSYASGGGSGAWNATFNSFRMTTSGAGSGIVVVQSRQTHPYYAGQTQEFEFTTLNFNTTGGNTAVIKRIGYFYHYVLTAPTSGDTLDGIYFESTNGVVTLKVVHQGTTVHSAAQSAWIYDTLDGTGPSGVTIDWSKFQVFLCSFLYLGGAVLNVYFFQNGGAILVHRFWNTNSGTTVYMGNPNQPFTAELIDTVGATAATFDFLCGTVTTANRVSDFSGRLCSVAKLNSTNSISNTSFYLLIGIRLDKTNVENRNVAVQVMGASVSSNSANSAYIVYILRNPTTTLGTGSWTNYSSTDNDVQYFLANESAADSTWTYSTDTIVYTQVVSERSVFNIDRQQLPRLGVPANPSGSWDEVWLGVRRYSTNAQYHGSLSWIVSV